MTNLKITDVRALEGDSAFLIDDGKTSILYDTGFAFTGYKIADNIKNELRERSLDYIFLTHSHYDHALGSAYVVKRYPDAKVVAGEYAKKIFERPTARKTMRELDRSFAKKCGVFEYEDLIDELKVDIAVSDTDVIHAGDMNFTVINLPGHTKCSVGFYLAENKLLLGSETLGVYCGENLIIPSYLIGYKTTLESIRRVNGIDIENILLPHYGLIGKEETKKFLHHARLVAIEVGNNIKEILASGGTKHDAQKYFEENFYTERVRPKYPIDAFRLNTGIMIELIAKEIL